MKSKVFIKYVVSYLLVLVIPVILIGAFNYGRFVTILSDEVTSSSQGLLYQIRDVSDGYIGQLDVISYIACQNKRVYPLISQPQSNDRGTFPDVYNCMNELKNYKLANSMIDHVFLYLIKRDEVISDCSMQSFDSTFGYSYKFKDTSINELKKSLNSIEDSRIWPSKQVTDGNDVKSVISYARKLPIKNSGHMATIIITLNDSIFTQIINNALNEKKGAVLILDRENNIIFNTNSAGIDLQGSNIKSFLLSTKENNRNSYTEVKGNVLLSYVRSTETGWCYVAAIPASQILDKVEYVKLRSIIIFAITMLIGIFLSYMFSRGNYTDVKRIADIIMPHGNDPSHNMFKNEWELINKAVSGYIIENTSLQQKLFEQMPVLRNSYLIKLVNGDFSSPEAVNSVMEFLKIDMKQEMLAVILIAIDDYKAFTSDHNELEQGIMKVALSEAAVEICNNLGRSYSVETENNKTAIILDIDAKNYKGIVELQDLGFRIRDFVMSDFNFTVTIAVSTTCSSIPELKRVYSEACEALDFKVIKGENSVICYPDIKKNAADRKFYSLKQEMQIVKCLRHGEYEQINDILNGIVNAVKNESVSLAMVKCIYLDIINTAIKASGELEIDGSCIELNLPSLVQQETLEGVCREVCKFYEYICEQANNAKKMEAVESVKKVLEYLDESYADKSLSVESAASQLSISSSYFSRLFKEKIGSNFVDYLHHIRLTKAKELLLTTDKSVTEISDEVGYNSIHNFVRVFKRYENITPSEYRLK